MKNNFEYHNIGIYLVTKYKNWNSLEPPLHQKRVIKAIKSGNALVIGVIVIFCLGIIFLGLEVYQAIAIPKNNIQMPKYGWYVCQDLGVGPIPDANPAQRFILCHPGGWEMFTYCIDQTKPSPPIGTICEYIGDDTFWCVDPYQPLKIFEISTTPTPTMTPSSTLTVTPTFTTTPTHTPTHTVTSTPTRTATRTMTPTETITATPTSTITSTLEVTQTITVTYETSTSTPTPTRTERPKLGGGEIPQREHPKTSVLKALLPFLGGSFLAFGLVLWWIARKK